MIMRGAILLFPFLLASPVLGQKSVGIDMHCCDPGGGVHKARDCRGCGVYEGAALLCMVDDAQFRILEIQLPQGFTDVEGIKVKARIRPIKGHGSRFRIEQIKRVATGTNAARVTIEAQTVDGSKPTPPYYVYYRIKGK